MSDRDIRRVGVLRRVASGELSLRGALALLEVSYRHARRLLKRYREEGAGGLVHRGLGRVSNRGSPSAAREVVMALVREHYGGPARRARKEHFGELVQIDGRCVCKAWYQAYRCFKPSGQGSCGAWPRHDQDRLVKSCTWRAFQTCQAQTVTCQSSIYRWVSSVTGHFA